MHEQADLPRATVSGQTDVHGAIHNSDFTNITTRETSSGTSEEQAWRDRAQRFKDLHDQRMASLQNELAECRRDFNLFHDGYSELVKAHTAALIELSILKDESPRYPLKVSSAVAEDIFDEFMNQL